MAIAIGALSHYIGDSIGHSEATNLAVPLEFPKLRAKYGSSVSYAEGKNQHVQIEFAFDINEIAHHRVAPLRFLRHIGLRVSTRQLALAFYQTYGFTETFGLRRGRIINVRDYRFATRTFIPRIAYALTLLHRSSEPPDPTSPAVVELEKEAAALDQENNWQAYRRKAGIETHLLAGLIFILPKIGPLALLNIKGPTQKTEEDYAHSVAVATTDLRLILAAFTPVNARSTAPPSPLTSLVLNGPPTLIQRDRRHPLLNRDLDTGRVVEPGGYSLTDSTYADLLHKLAAKPDLSIPPGVKHDVEAYYSDLNLPIATKKDPARWSEVLADLKTLAGMSTSNEPQPYPTYGADQGSDE
jgi:hypothetical protein